MRAGEATVALLERALLAPLAKREALLVDPRIAVSGSGLMKSIEFQEIDRIVDDFVDLRMLESYKEMQQDSHGQTFSKFLA